MFGRRDAPYLIGVEANWDEPAADDANVGWARAVYDDMRPFSPGGVYPNFPDADLDDWDPAYHLGNRDRLLGISARYDPDGSLTRRG